MRLTPLPPREVIRRLRVFGYNGPSPGGKHQRMVHQTTNLVVQIPIHGNKDVGVGVIRAILRRTGITREQWNSV